MKEKFETKIVEGVFYMRKTIIDSPFESKVFIRKKHPTFIFNTNKENGIISFKTNPYQNDAGFVDSIWWELLELFQSIKSGEDEKEKAVSIFGKITNNIPGQIGNYMCKYAHSLYPLLKTLSSADIQIGKIVEFTMLINFIEPSMEPMYCRTFCKLGEMIWEKVDIEIINDTN